MPCRASGRVSSSAPCPGNPLTDRTSSSSRPTSPPASRPDGGHRAPPLGAQGDPRERARRRAGRIEVRGRALFDHCFQVADDGHGIAAGELELALERHATSKLGSLDDLDRLYISGSAARPASSRRVPTPITSRAAWRESGTWRAVDGGAPPERGRRARTAHVDVRDLFFNTPARRKFLAARRRAAGRPAHARAYGLAFPAVSFRLRRRRSQPSTGRPPRGRASPPRWSGRGRVGTAPRGAAPGSRGRARRRALTALLGCPSTRARTATASSCSQPALDPEPTRGRRCARPTATSSRAAASRSPPSGSRSRPIGST